MKKSVRSRLTSVIRFSHVTSKLPLFWAKTNVINTPFLWRKAIDELSWHSSALNRNKFVFETDDVRNLRGVIKFEIQERKSLTAGQRPPSPVKSPPARCNAVRSLPSPQSPTWGSGEGEKHWQEVKEKRESCPHLFRGLHAVQLPSHVHNLLLGGLAVTDGGHSPLALQAKISLQLCLIWGERVMFDTNRWVICSLRIN